MTSTLEPGQSSNFKTLIYYDKTRQFQLRVTRKVWPLLLIPTVHGVSMLEPIGASAKDFPNLQPQHRTGNPMGPKLEDDDFGWWSTGSVACFSSSFPVHQLWLDIQIERDAGLRLTTQTTQWIWMFALRTRKAPLQQGKSSVLFAWSIASLASPNNKQLSRLSLLPRTEHSSLHERAGRFPICHHRSATSCR